MQQEGGPKAAIKKKGAGKRIMIPDKARKNPGGITADKLKPLRQACGWFNRFCKDVEQMICSRSHRPGESGFHHRGVIGHYLASQGGLPGRDLETFMEDSEHGLFHGMMTAFAPFVLNGQISEQTLATCVLHDFCRCRDPEMNRHDFKLKEVFPKLDPVAYTHTNPPVTETPLVMGDRWELRRFSDWEDWVKKPMLASEPNNVLDLFYTHIRPALEAFWSNRRELWMRHGPEHLKVDLADPGGYPNFHKMDAASIELDRFPFKRCVLHGQRGMFGPLGAVRVVKSRNEVMIHPNGRDHLAMVGKYPIQDWYFIGKGSFEDPRLTKHMEQIVDLKLPFVARNVMDSFWLAITLLEDRILALNLDPLTD